MLTGVLALLGDQLSPDSICIQSMVAQVAQEDPGKRTFLILPMEAQGLGYSDSIVKKYGLDYNQIAERVAALNYSSQNGELL